MPREYRQGLAKANADPDLDLSARLKPVSSPHPRDHLLMFKAVLEQWFPAQEIGTFTGVISIIQDAGTRESPWCICVLGTAAGIEPIRTAVRASTRADMRLRARRFD